MNKVLLAVGLLSAGMAVGQTPTTRPSSTTTNTSNYSTTDTQNYNSQNATMGTNSSTNKPTSTTGNPNNRTGSSTTGTGSTMGTGSNSMGTGSSTSGSYNSNSGMSTGGAGTSNSGMSTSTGSTGTNPSGGGNTTNSMGTGSSTTTPSTSGGYNSNSTGTGTSTSGSYNSNRMSSDTTITPSTTTNGSYNTNSRGTGSSATTPSTSGGYNSNTGTSNSSTYSTPSTASPYKTKDYKNFAYGIYAGLNSTRFRGESIDAQNPAGRIGYQAGFFVRGGGRLYGQIGAEYFASSSNYFRPGDGQSAAAISDQINIQYIQVPVYIGVKLTESDRGISAIRLQAGAEYANRISASSGQFNLSNSEIKSGSFNALGQLGFDIGPFLIDLTYHHGLSNAVQITNFQGSARRILSASVGFKF